MWALLSSYSNSSKPSSNFGLRLLTCSIFPFCFVCGVDVEEQDAVVVDLGLGKCDRVGRGWLDLKAGAKSGCGKDPRAFAAAHRFKWKCELSVGLGRPETYYGVPLVIEELNGFGPAHHFNRMLVDKEHAAAVKRYVGLAAASLVRS